MSPDQKPASLINSKVAKEGAAYAVVSEMLDTDRTYLIEAPSQGRIQLYTVDGDYLATVNISYDPARSTTTAGQDRDS
jgi:hypothetical protein